MYFRWTSQPTTTLRNAQGPLGEGQLHKGHSLTLDQLAPEASERVGAPGRQARVRWLLRSTSDKKKGTHTVTCAH